jgi:hypothetical protein
MRKRDIRSATRKRRNYEDEVEWDHADDIIESSQYGSDNRRSYDPTITQGRHGQKSEFLQRVDDAHESLQQKIALELRPWSQEEIESEVIRSPMYSKRHTLLESISYVESGLIERNAEARLVVLGMVSKEHVLFIGPPGEEADYSAPLIMLI